MGLGVFSTTPFVHVDVVVAIDGKGGVWVDSYEEKSGIGVYKIGLVSHV